MSNDELERRFNNFQETILQNQARFSEDMTRMQEAIAGLIQVARLHDEQLDRHSEQIKVNTEQITALIQQGKEQTDKINALIRIVEGHLSNHP